MTLLLFLTHSFAISSKLYVIKLSSIKRELKQNIPPSVWLSINCQPSASGTNKQTKVHSGDFELLEAYKSPEKQAGIRAWVHRIELQASETRAVNFNVNIHEKISMSEKEEEKLSFEMWGNNQRMIQRWDFTPE